MQIIKKQGIYQIEDWSADYPALTWMHYCVGCYPKAQRGCPYWLHDGSKVRVCLQFATMQEAEGCFSALVSGEKCIRDYAAVVYDPRTLSYME